MNVQARINTTLQGETFENVVFEKHLITFEGKEVMHNTKDDFDSLNEVMMEIKFGDHKEFHKVYYCNHTYSDSSIWFIVIDGKAIRIPHYINVFKLAVSLV